MRGRIDHGSVDGNALLAAGYTKSQCFKNISLELAIEETKAASNSHSPESLGRDGKKKGKRGKHENSLKNLKPYVPGVSGNPGGKPGYDVAAALARAVIEGAQEDAYAGLAKALAQGNGYVFKELADRGYGPMKQKIEVGASNELMNRLIAGRKRLSGK